MTSSSFFTYLAVTFVLVVTPGASTAVVIRNTLAGGRSLGVAAAAGAAVGNTSYALASSLGLAVLFARWPSAPGVLAVLGALYFVWLGGDNLLRAARPAAFHVVVDTGAARSELTAPESFRQGVGVNLLNPAIATFYLSIVPSFIPRGAPWWSFGALAASHVTLAFLCHSAWAVALDRVSHLFERRAIKRTIEAAAGLTMLLLAWRVLATLWRSN